MTDSFPDPFPDFFSSSPTYTQALDCPGFQCLTLSPFLFPLTHSRGGFIHFSQCSYHLNIISVLSTFSLPPELQSLDLPACLIFLLEYPISFQSYHVQNQTLTTPSPPPPPPAPLAAWPVFVASKAISSLPGT